VLAQVEQEPVVLGRAVLEALLGRAGAVAPVAYRARGLADQPGSAVEVAQVVLASVDRPVRELVVARVPLESVAVAGPVVLLAQQALASEDPVAVEAPVESAAQAPVVQAWAAWVDRAAADRTVVLLLSATFHKVTRARARSRSTARARCQGRLMMA
jgi:hypothetical protein